MRVSAGEILSADSADLSALRSAVDDWITSYEQKEWLQLRDIKLTEFSAMRECCSAFSARMGPKSVIGNGEDIVQQFMKRLQALQNKQRVLSLFRETYSAGECCNSKARECLDQSVACMREHLKELTLCTEEDLEGTMLGAGGVATGFEMIGAVTLPQAVSRITGVIPTVSCETMVAILYALFSNERVEDEDSCIAPTLAALGLQTSLIGLGRTLYWMDNLDKMTEGTDISLDASLPLVRSLLPGLIESCAYRGEIYLIETLTCMYQSLLGRPQDSVQFQIALLYCAFRIKDLDLLRDTVGCTQNAAVRKIGMRLCASLCVSRRNAVPLENLLTPHETDEVLLFLLAGDMSEEGRCQLILQLLISSGRYEDSLEEAKRMLAKGSSSKSELEKFAATISGIVPIRQGHRGASPLELSTNSSKKVRTFGTIPFSQ